MPQVYPRWVAAKEAWAIAGVVRIVGKSKPGLDHIVMVLGHCGRLFGCRGRSPQMVDSYTVP